MHLFILFIMGGIKCQKTSKNKVILVIINIVCQVLLLFLPLTYSVKLPLSIPFYFDVVVRFVLGHGL